MNRATLMHVGPFNEAFRFHLDNEWLGRLAQAGIPRVHFIESTAPKQVDLLKQVRPWLAHALNLSGNQVRLARHNSPYPLVRRLVHSASGTAQIAANASLAEISLREQIELMTRFGRIPW
jgi:hypothetical protein